MNYPDLLTQVKDYVRLYYKKHADEQLVYHNLEHARNVQKAVMQIGDHYQLKKRDAFALQTAAWFHDLGYVADKYNHGEGSAMLAESFLKQYHVDAGIIDTVKDCIKATKLPQKPATQLGEIICDADAFYLGAEDFFKLNKQLYQEQLATGEIAISKNDWRIRSAEFLEGHQYYTDYCQVLLDKGKLANLKKLNDKIIVFNNKHTEDAITVVQAGADQPLIAEEVKKKNCERPDKGIETMFKISSGNHQRLSDMADNKAHIMITVNSIILSAIISLLLRKLAEYHYLIVPTFILLGVSLLAITLAILSTRPCVPRGVFKHADLENKKVNLLFFGNFYKMPFTEFNYGMLRMMEDRDFLYGSLIHDVYTQGVVLGKKYRLLRYAYSIFMFGLILAVLAFIIASAVYYSNPVA